MDHEGSEYVNLVESMSKDGSEMYNLFKCDVQLNEVREGQSSQGAGETTHLIHRCEIQREKPI